MTLRFYNQFKHIQRKIHDKNLPTIPKRMQYTAANIGKGIDANKAPNLPVRKSRIEFVTLEQILENFKFTKMSLREKN